jgi:hypothetical protein
MIGHYLPNNNENATVPILPKKFGTKLGLCLNQFVHYTKKRFPIISNLRYMYGVLNVDKNKN